MNTNTTISLDDAIKQVVAAMNGPLPREEFYRRVLAIRPSQAKRPEASILQAVRWGRGSEVIYLAKTYVPLQQALQGIRFRIPLERYDVEHGVLFQADFYPFLHHQTEEVVLLDERGTPLPVIVRKLPEKHPTPLSALFGRTDANALDLAVWLKAHQARRNDSVLVTLVDWRQATFQLEHEPYQRRNQRLIEVQNKALADTVYALMEDTVRERMMTTEAIVAAYVKLPTARDYPGDHWTVVIDNDPRMRNTGFDIAPKDFRIPLDMLYGGDEDGVRESPFSPQAGKQVYRFKTTFAGRKIPWRQIEILGKQTLIELDRVMRDAFDHDQYDHLSEFRQVIPRGKGKKPREIEFGTINPFEKTTANGLHIAGLGLQTGANLTYVYDFGDWIEHDVTLEAIAEPVAGVKYPRIAAQNKPQYAPCQECQRQGRSTNAKWFCVDCSNEQGREVLVCGNCLAEKHQDHYANEIVY